MSIKITNGRISGTITHTAGWEAAPLAALVTPDLNGDGNHIGFDAPFEFGVGGVLVFGVYNAVLVGLQLEPLVRGNLLSRQDQMVACWEAAGDSIKNNWLKIAAVSVLCSLLPGLVPVVGAATVFSSVFMANKLVRSFWLALTPEQQQQLTTAAEKAGVNLPDEAKTSPSTGNAAGYSELDPMPAGA